MLTGPFQVDTAEDRKARGAFFTPPEICAFLVAWAVRRASDRILEPSCGEAAFLTAAGRRLSELGASDTRDQLHGFQQLHGVELHEASALNAVAVATRASVGATIHVGDFFDFNMQGSFDAVVGNPPYVRYQDFAGASRLKAQKAALAQGVRLTGLASSWAAFVPQATRLLSPTGHLALVLPAELLTVNYAAPIRKFLLDRFATVRLVMFEERVFPGVLEEVVLLLAEGQGPTDHFVLHQLTNLDSLGDADQIAAPWSPQPPSAKWSAALLPPGAAHVYGQLAGEGRFVSLETWGDTNLGMVTGNNRYFTMSEGDAVQAGLTARDLLSISPPGSRHLRGLTFTESAWREMADTGGRVHLFYPQEPLSTEARRYIEAGEAAGVHRAYKCRVRSPWWRVPLVAPPHLLLTYMNHDTPRLVRNSARVTYLNSVHGVTLRKGLQQTGQDLLPIGALNSMTLLGAEMVGRSYGGGILKVEPKEADVLPVPSPSLLESVASSLHALRPQLSQALRGGSLLSAVEMIDRVLLVDGLKMGRRDVKVLREARDAMFSRRAARS